MTEKRQRRRIILVCLALGLAWTGLSIRLIYLHLGDNGDLRDRVARIRTVEKDILVGRGRILDRNGNIMALDLALKHVFVDPKIVLDSGHSRFVIRQLARLLELDPAMVASKVNRPERRFEFVKTFVHEDLAQQIRSMGMHGVHFEDVSARHYPQGMLMGHILGFSNIEGVGSAGVEQRYDRYLRGVRGLRVTEVDGRRREVYDRRGIDIQPQEGADVVLTVDQNLQHFVERALDRAMTDHNAKGAWAIVQHVRTGDILAMASRPAFDLNEYRHSREDERLNRAIGFVYEPGSTFKVAVYAAAFNEGLIRPDQIIDCENGRWIHNGRPLRDFHPYGRLTIADALKKSSNIAAAKVALQLGEARLYQYLREFGVGRHTGVGLPGEEAGILNPRNRWTSLSVSRIAMGHEVAVTGLQMVNMQTALGNGGFLMRPRIVQRVVNNRGDTVMEFKEEVLSRPVNADAARLMCRLLSLITEPGGTGVRAKIDGYRVAGKTGTAQKPIPGGYSDDDNIASFMGLIPAEEPQLSIIVVVDEPQPEHTGGRVAAPVFKEIAEQAVRYLDIPPVSADTANRFKALYVERPM
ncbi:MAG TPA: penicillin-binding protein 2 [Kiritimatiellia bacterium]|nr:penicillin-binding protein 2 [Kiritimatiellia bacterium]